MPKVRNLTSRLESVQEELNEWKKTSSANNKHITKAMKVIDSLVEAAKKAETPKKTGVKKPLNAYMQFAAKHREEVKKNLSKNGSVDVTDVAKELGRLWREAKENGEVETVAPAKKASRK